MKKILVVMFLLFSITLYSVEQPQSLMNEMSQEATRLDSVITQLNADVVAASKLKFNDGYKNRFEVIKKRIAESEAAYTEETNKPRPNTQVMENIEMKLITEKNNLARLIKEYREFESK